MKTNFSRSRFTLHYITFDINLLTATVGYGRLVKMCPTRRRRVSPTIIDASWAHCHLSAIPDRGGQKVKQLKRLTRLKASQD
jgi:hypothetical protein